MERTIQEWLIQIDKDTKEKQKRDTFDLWLACRGQSEISESIGVDQSVVSDWTKGFMEIGNLSESHKSRANLSGSAVRVDEAGGSWQFRVAAWRSLADCRPSSD